jgi:CBS-domain-containing membrane protein
MRAADVVETLPTVPMDADLLSAVRLVVGRRLPGLVVADDRGQVVGCMSLIDLLRVALPRYLHEDPNLARVFDDEHADRIAATLVGSQVKDVVGRGAERIPLARARATLVELAELMVQWSCPLVVVAREDGATLGVVSADRLLDLLVSAAGGASP